MSKSSRGAGKKSSTSKNKETPRGGTASGQSEKHDAVQDELAELRQVKHRYDTLHRKREDEAKKLQQERDELVKERAAIEAQKDALSKRAEAMVAADVSERMAKAQTVLSTLQVSKVEVEQRLEALKDALGATQATAEATLGRELAGRRAAVDHELAKERVKHEAWAQTLRSEVHQQVADAQDAAQQRIAERMRKTQERASTVLDDAQKLADSAVSDAHKQAAVLRATAMADVEAQRQVLNERSGGVEAELAQIERRSAELARQERDLTRREDELDRDLAHLAQQAQAFDAREARLGLHRVAELEQRVDELTVRWTTASERATGLATERDALQSTLDEVGGPGATARLRELEHLRSRVGELQVELARAGDAERVGQLQEEVERLKRLADGAQAAHARIAELERVQADVDQRVREVRGEADRAAGERDRLTHDLAERVAELNEARTEASRLMTLEQDVTRLRVERDWQDQEIGRLSRKLDVRTNARDRSMDRHYGPLATLDAREQDLLEEQRVPIEPVTSPGSLKTLVNRLQARMHHHRENKTDTGRRYRKDDIRGLLGALAGSRMIVLKGLSGTGKTSLPLYAARAMGAAVARIPVQSGWRDRMDLLGTYNAFTEEFRPTAFTEAVYTANLPRFRERPFFIILDECNLSRVEYYFADLMSELQDAKDMHTVRLMERAPGEESPEHLKDGHTLQLPPNVWFFLTANEDESTFELADKTFDRSLVLQMDDAAPPLDVKPQKMVPVAFDELQKALRGAAIPLSGTTNQWVDDLRKELSRADGLRLSLGNRFPAQAEAFVGVFVEAGGTEAEALDRLVSTKVLRKLERERDPSRKQDLENVQQLLTKAPGRLIRCEAMMDRVIGRLS